MTSQQKHEYLTTDPITVPGQKYALVSFVSPTGNQKADKLAMKIRGCFQTIDEARDHAKHLSQMDPSFDVYVVEMYNWLAIPPNPDEINDQEHQDKWLNDFVKGHKDEQMKAKTFFEQRKNDMLDNIKDDNSKKEKELEEASDTLLESDPWMASKNKNEE